MASGTATDSGLTLVGRDEEQTQLLRALGREPGNAVLHGPAGIGKTHLAAAVAASIEGPRCTVTRVVGTRAAVGIPLGALAHLLPPLPELAVGDASTAAPNDLTLLQHAIDALTKLAGERELVVVVDDAQFLDPTSSLALHQLAVTRSVKLLLTVRSSDPVPDPISSLWTNGDATRLDLHALDDAAVSSLLADTLGAAVEGATAHRVAQLSQGNPLFALELAAAARRDGWLSEVEGVWRLREGWRPVVGEGRLADLLTERARAVDGVAREALELLALAEVLPLPEAESQLGSAALEELERTQLVTVSERGGRQELRPRHPLVAELIRNDIPSGRRRDLYAQLAASAGQGGHVGGEEAMRRASWLLESGASEPTLFAWAARYARFANDNATGMRFARAAYDAVPNVEIGVLAGEMSYQLGDYGESHRWLTDAADVATTDEELALVVINHLSTVYWGLGDWAACEELVADFRWRFPDSDWVDDLAGLLASLDVFSGRPDVALERLGPLRRRDDLRAQVEIAFVEAGALAMAGLPDRAVEVATVGFELHAELGEQLGLGNSGGHMLTSLAALASSHHLTEAEAMGQSLYDAVVEAPHSFATVLVTFANGRTALARGRPATAERWFREGAAVARDNIDGDQLRWSLGGLALSLAIQGRAAEARLVLEEAEQIRGLACLNDNEMELARAWIEVDAGDLGRAVGALERAASGWAARGFVANEVRALHACVSLDAADRVVNRLEGLAVDAESRLVHLAARQARAVVDRDVDAMEDVAAGYAELGATFSAAEAFAQAARASRHADAARRGTGLDRQARELLAACEGASNPVLFGAEEPTPLTRREREIALLAARGQRSQEIADQLHVSVRTVDNHLHRAYAKLGITAREGLADAMGIA